MRWPSITVKQEIAGQPWAVEDAPIEIVLQAKSLDSWGIVDKMIEPLPESPVKAGDMVEDITFIPMGCARLRVSCLPIAE